MQFITPQVWARIKIMGFFILQHWLHNYKWAKKYIIFYVHLNVEQNLTYVGFVNQPWTYETFHALDHIKDHVGLHNCVTSLPRLPYSGTTAWLPSQRLNISSICESNRGVNQQDRMCSREWEWMCTHARTHACTKSQKEKHNTTQKPHHQQYSSPAITIYNLSEVKYMKRHQPLPFYLWFKFLALFCPTYLFSSQPINQCWSGFHLSPAVLSIVQQSLKQYCLV